MDNGNGVSVESRKDQLLAQLTDQRQRLNDIIENLPGIVWECWGAPGSSQHKVTYVSPYFEAVFGCRREEWLSCPDPWARICHPDDLPRAIEEARHIFEAADHGSIQIRCRAKDGRILWVEVFATVVKNPDGRPIGARGVAMDVTERKRAEEIIINSERAKREFVANVSHDFRTPIAAIKGYAETLLRGALEDPKEGREFARTILRNADRLAALVEDILMLSALDESKMEFRPQRIDLRAFLEEYLDELRPLARRNDNQMQVQVDQGVMAWADRTHLGRVLRNLLSNALKYNRKGGWVRVKAESREGKLVVSIKDSGIGIAREHLPQIFERFYRVDKARSREPGESGLGLHIAKQLLEGTGNRIWVNSAEGKGSTFYFTVDLPPVPS
ncbi:MAG: PAS domain-containing protein [Elusimicrobia bacterium]|nr:PAS domain-containing protein [Elusimicrobiota bacterium]